MGAPVNEDVGVFTTGIVVTGRVAGVMRSVLRLRKSPVSIIQGHFHHFKVHMGEECGGQLEACLMHDG